MKTITVQTKSVYGVEKIYPVCNNALIFAQLSGTKTLSQDNLEKIRMLGYEIQCLVTGGIQVMDALCT